MRADRRKGGGMAGVEELHEQIVAGAAESDALARHGDAVELGADRVEYWADGAGF